MTDKEFQSTVKYTLPNSSTQNQVYSWENQIKKEPVPMPYCDILELKEKIAERDNKIKSLTEELKSVLNKLEKNCPELKSWIEYRYGEFLKNDN